MSTPPPDPQGQPYPSPPASPTPPPAYAGAPGAVSRPKGPARLGVVAFAVAVASVVIGSILVFIGGTQLGVVGSVTGDGTTPVDPSELTPAIEQAGMAGGILSLTGFIVMFLLALWGLVQGIVAAVKNRGRGWAIAAIVIGVIAWVPVAVFFGIGTAVGVATAG